MLLQSWVPAHPRQLRGLPTGSAQDLGTRIGTCTGKHLWAHHGSTVCRVPTLSRRHPVSGSMSWSMTFLWGWGIVLVGYTLTEFCVTTFYHKYILYNIVMLELINCMFGRWIFVVLLCAMQSWVPAHPRQLRGLPTGSAQDLGTHIGISGVRYHFTPLVILPPLNFPWSGIRVGVWKRFFENFEFCIGCNFGAKCPFLIVLGLI